MLSQAAILRTGAVLSRMQENGGRITQNRYELLSLRNIDEKGRIWRNDCAHVNLKTDAHPDMFTKIGDVLVRLSYPYTVIYIESQCDCGLIIPSHFGIVRTKGEVLPEYLYAVLDSDFAQKDFVLNASGSTVLGTISVKNIGAMHLPVPSIKYQRLIGAYHICAKKEIRLLEDLTREKARLLSLVNNKLIGQAKGERV